MSAHREKGEITVNEALSARNGLNADIAGADPDDASWLRVQAAGDPTYIQGDWAHEFAGNFASGLSRLIEQRVQNSVSPQVVEPNSTRNKIDDLLAELEKNPILEKEARTQKHDIAQVHSYISEYEKQRRAFGTKPNRKQRDELERIKKRGFRERWSADEIGDKPSRLGTILDGVLCAEGISKATKDTVASYVTDRVSEHVAQTAATVHPDIIGERISESFKPGFSRELRQRALLGSYFRAAEGEPTEAVIDNYERFVRGIFRVANQPEACRQAIAVASFETDLLPSDGIYQFRAKVAPGLRLDRPELAGRVIAARKAISLTKLHIGDDPTSMGKQFGVDDEEFHDLLAALEGKHPDQITRKQRQKFQSGFSRLKIGELSQAFSELGLDEFNRRRELFNTFRNIISDPSTPGFEIGDPDELGYLKLTTGLDVVLESACRTRPDARDILTRLINAQSIVAEEVTEFFRDRTTSTTDMFGFIDQSFLGEITRSTASALKAFSPEATDEDIDSALDFIKTNTKQVSYKTEDGYILETVVHADNPDPDQSFWEVVLREHQARISLAKEKISATAGMRRKADFFVAADAGNMFIVRPESEEDRKAYHPVDEMLGILDTDISDVDLNLVIEHSRNQIETQQRRFLNERGIIAVFEEEDKSGISIELHKHPQNPSFSIVTARMVDSNGMWYQARILMDDNMRFQLGDKKVSSPHALLFLNALTADLMAYFACQLALQTEEGEIREENNSVDARIAHLRFRTDGGSYSYQAWENCLEIEGKDLEVLSKQRAERENSPFKSTYVKAVKKDGPELLPLRVYLSNTTSADAGE